MPPTIRRATLQDAALLADLGARTFYEAFAGDNTPHNIDRYIARAFNAEQMAAELARKRGFDDVGTKTFTVGRDVQNDVVMVHLLARNQPTASPP